MTSFYPAVPQTLDALKKPPAGLELVHVDYEGSSYERLWLAVRGVEGRSLCVTRDLTHPATIELTRYGNDEPNAVLQALADHWGCTIMSEYGTETFQPSTKGPSEPPV